ncbi:DDE-type integrase/transposase/recombinase, partial [Stenotrophomonas sp. NPDC077659]|uniref:DDE-type integrase/transposase/recombinase n=1 Tax=Stenotrophomonas sp. NPDC077659 TaxID=3390694 RepID=UPI003CFDD9A8
MAIDLVDQAVAAGAAQSNACEVLGITCRTLRRWRSAASLRDRRKGAARRCPQALSEQQKDVIVEVCNQLQFQSLPPSQIVPRLADQGQYLASESTLYRVLRQRGQINRRGRARASRTISRPRAVSASASNQVWSWDITYLPTAIKGQFFRLYMVMDIYSRRIVGWEVHQDELASHAAVLIQKTCARECVLPGQLVLHADNG